MAVGVIFTELDLDMSKFVAKQKKLLNDIKKVGVEAEKGLQQSFTNLGVTSDNVYQLMVNKAVKSYERIAQSAKASCDEQFRAQSAMVAQINAVHQKLNANPLYETLGIKSQAAYKAQEAAIMASYNTIKQSGTATADDLIRIERAKNAKLKSLHKEMAGEHEMSMAAMMRAVLRFYAAWYVASSAVQLILIPLKTAMQYLSTIETSSLGIAASFMTSGKFVDKFTGKVLEGQEALRTARGLSMSIVKELEYANLQTIATLDELIIAYQTALPVALARGFNVKQVKDFTVAMVQAAGAIGLPMNQMAEEIRSLLTGAITPRNTRIATVLGLRNEDINEYKNNAQGLFDFLMNKLSAYQVSGIEAQNTWAGLWSNTKDIVNQLLGNTFEPLFAVIKYEMQNMIDNVVTLDKTTRTIKWNQSFLDAIKDIKEGIHTALADMYRVGMLLDIAGGSLNKFKMSLYSIGNLAGYGPSVKRFEDAADSYLDYEKRFLASDKALMDMAMREQGFSPTTAVTKGAEKVVTALGQILYYRKELQKTNNEYTPNKGDTSGFFETLGIKSVEAIEAQKSAVINAYEEIKKSGTATAQDLINAERTKNEKLKALNDEMLGIGKRSSKAAKESNREQESATKSAIEATRKASYEIDSVGISQYQKDIDRINAQAEKYRDAKVNEITIEKYVQAETALAKRKSFEVDAENARKMYEEMKKGKEEYQSLLDDLQSATMNAHEKAMQQISKAEDEVYKKIEKLLDEAKISWEQAQALFNLVPAKTAVATTDETIRDTQSYADFYSTIEGYEQQAYDKKIELIELERKARIEAAKGAAEIIAAANAKAHQSQLAAYSEKIDAEQKWSKTAISSATSILDNALSCYAEDSYEYKRIQDLKKVMLVAEMAMEAIKNAQLLAFMIAQNAAYAAAMVKKEAGLQLTAAEVILTQGTGDPYTAFARIAAAAAVVASVLGMVGLAFGGGNGGSGSAPVSTPSYKFSSSVLGGEEGELSESLKKSWEFLEDTYDMEYEKLTKIHNELKDLNDNITGLVTSIIRTGSVSMAGRSGESYNQGSIGAYGAAGFFSDPLTGMLFAGLTSLPVETQGKIVSQIVAAASADPFTAMTHQIIEALTGGAFGENVGNFLSGIFGGKTEYWSGASGIGIGGGSIGGFNQGGGTSGWTYQNMHSKKDGGWFGSDEYSSWTEYSGLDASVVDLFSKVYQNLSDTLVELTIGLGQDVTKTLAYVFPGGGLVLNGLNAQQISETLTNYFSAQADAAVQTLFGALLKGYQEVGESLMDTAVRLMVDKEIVLEVLQQTNHAYSGSTANAIALSEALIKLAGNLETLTDIASTYYDKFFTDEEKHLRLQEQLTTIFSTMNRTLPATRQAYRDVVESLDLTTTSGQYAYATLLKLAESADTYYSTLEDMAEELTETAKALQAAMSSTNDAISEQISLANTAASAARSAANEYRNIIKSLTDAQQSIRGGGLIELTERFEKLFAIAMTGDREALSALPGAADKLLAGSLASSRTALDYARDQGKMLLALEEAKAVSVEGANWQDYQATLLETQVNVLEQIRDELAAESPDLALLEQHAGLLENIATLLGGQTSEIITGNATQDVIANLSGLDASYSAEMLNALVSREMSQAVSLENILTANNATVSLLRQLVDLTTASAMEKSLAEIKSAYGTIQSASTSLQAALTQNSTATQNLSTAQSAIGQVPTTLADVMARNAGVAYSSADAAAQPGVYSEALGRMSKEQLISSLFSSGLGSAITQKEYSYIATNYNDRWQGYAHYYLDENGILRSAYGGTYHADLGQGWSEGGATSSAGITASVQSGISAKQSAYATALAATQQAMKQVESANQKLADAQSEYSALVARYESTFGSTPAFASGGPFSGGLRIVGEQGPELEYTGPSHIVNASKTEAFMSSNADLLAEIKKLNAKVDKLEAGNYQIVKNTLKTAKTLEKFDYDGLPAERAA